MKTRTATKRAVLPKMVVAYSGHMMASLAEITPLKDGGQACFEGEALPSFLGPGRLVYSLLY